MHGLFADIFDFLDFLEFMIEDGGCCCVFLLIIMGLVICILALQTRRGKQTDLGQGPNQPCPKCQSPCSGGSRFCSVCGAAFDFQSTSGSFYDNLRQRLGNWKKWNWVTEDEVTRFEEVAQRDQEVYDRTTSSDSVVPAATDSEEAPIDLTEYQNVPAIPTAAREVPAAPTDPAAVPEPAPVIHTELSPSEIKDPIAVTAAPPARKLSELLRAFMDESNIKVGEFVSGLLIVFGSIGLVVTLNQQFKDENVYLPSVVFMTIVTLFHILGIYSLKKWNLESSSKVILYIANLLVPLNFLAATLQNTAPDTQGFLFYVAMLVGIGGFGAMSYYSARAVSPARYWPIILAVLGPSVMQVINKLIIVSEIQQTVLTVNLMMLTPLALVSIAMLAEHRHFRKTKEADYVDAMSLLRVLSLGVFSLATCTAVLFSKLDTRVEALSVAKQLATPLLIICFMVVSSGVLIQRRFQNSNHLRLRMVGSWMAITGAMGIVGALTMAVPNINSMLVASVIGTALSLIFARVSRIPVLVTAGTLCAGVAAWCLFVKLQRPAQVMFTGRELVDLFFHGYHSLILTATSVGMLFYHHMVANVDEQRGVLSDQAIGLGTRIKATCTSLLSFEFGFMIDPSGFPVTDGSDAPPTDAHAGILGSLMLAVMGFLTACGACLLNLNELTTDVTLIVFVFYAVLLVIASTTMDRRIVSLASLGLITVCWLKAVNTQSWVVWDTYSGIDKFDLVTFGMAITCVCLLIGMWVGRQRHFGVLNPHSRSVGYLHMLGASFIFYLIAAVFTVVHIYFGQHTYQTALLHSLVLSVLMVIIALCYTTDWTWMFVQIQLIVTVALAVTLGMSLQHPEFDFFSGHHIRAQLIALSVGMIVWVSIRKYCQLSDRVNRVVITDMMYVDFVLQVMASVVMYLFWVSSLIEPLRATYNNSVVLNELAFSFGHVISHWDWILWFTTLAAWALVLPDRHRRISSFCGLLVFSAIPILAGDYFIQKYAVSGGNSNQSLHHFLRWGYSIFGILISILVCTDFVWWRGLQRIFPRFMDNQDDKSSGDHARHTWTALRFLSLLAAGLPVIFLTAIHYLYVTGFYLSNSTLDDMREKIIMSGGVEFFAQFPQWAFAGPLLLLMVTAWIYALRSRREAFLLLGFVFWQSAWMFFALMDIWVDDTRTHFGEVVDVVNWFLIGVAIYGAVWSGLSHWISRGNQNLQSLDWKTELFTVGGCGKILYGLTWALLAGYMLMANLDGLNLQHSMHSEIWANRSGAFASIGAYVALFSLAFSILLWPGGSNVNRRVWVLGITLMSLNALVAHQLAANPEVVQWRVLLSDVLFYQMMGWTFMVLLLTGTLTVIIPRLRKAASGQTEFMVDVDARVQRLFKPVHILGALILFAAAVLLFSHPFSDWWLVATLGVLWIAFLLLTAVMRDGVSVGWVILLAILMAALIDIKLLDPDMYLADQSIDRIVKHGLSLVRLEIVLLAALALVLQFSHGILGSWFGGVQPNPSLSLLAGRSLVRLSIVLLAVHSTLALMAEMLGEFSWVWITGQYEWLYFIVPLLALFLYGRDDEYREWFNNAYVMGVALIATLLTIWFDGPDTALERSRQGMTILYCIAGYLAVWGLIYQNIQNGGHLFTAIEKLGVMNVGKRIEEHRSFVSHTQIVVGVIVSVLACLSTFYLNPEGLLSHRYLAAVIPLLTCVGIQVFAADEFKMRRRQYVGYLILMAGLIVVWADVGTPLHSASTWLRRISRLFIGGALIGVVVSVYSSRVVQRFADWVDMLKRLQLQMLIVTGFALLVMLLLELTMRGMAQNLPDLEVWLATIAIFSLGVIFIGAALKPDQDPLALPDGARQAYVYLAEVLLLLLVAHLWATRPAMFGKFVDWWPYILMGIAFLGVVVSELLRRSKISVLSEPIYNTSFLLPAVPLLGLILFQGKTDNLFSDYKSLFLLAAVMNVLLAFFRRSFLHALLAAFAGNASLWMMFVGFEFELLSHLQMWLIPPAISVLIVAQIFRHNLSKENLSTIRYVTVSGIYLASTSEMLMVWAAGSQGTVELVVLALISLAGIGMGMLTRIRQFVYLGIAFLLLSFVGMFAKVALLGMLWVFVVIIVVGAIMLVLVMAREKYAPWMKQKLEEMDSWDS